MKRIFILSVLFFNFISSFSQTVKTDSILFYTYLSNGDSVCNTKSIQTYITYNNGHFLTNVSYLWDPESISWLNRYKYNNELDNNGNVIERITFNWDSDLNRWLSKTKDEYKWDSSNNQIFNAAYNWDLNKGDWIGTSKIENTFDSNSNLTSSQYFVWDLNSSQWIGSHKSEFSYDTNENLILEISYNWDISVEDWVVVYKKEYEFDNNGNQILQSIYHRDPNTSKLIGEIKYVREFASTGEKTVESQYFWDSSTNDWIGYTKVEYISESSKNHYPELVYIWDSTLDEWKKSVKYEYSFNSSGLITSSLRYKWDSTTNNWSTAEYKYEYTFDANGYEILYIGYSASIFGWVNSSKLENVYDSEGRRIMVASYSWDFTTDSWIGVHKEEYCYYNNGNIQHVTRYEWETSLGMWIGMTDKKVEYYDSFGKTTLYASYIWDTNLRNWVGLSKFERDYNNVGSITLQKSYRWNSGLNDWYLGGRTEYFRDINDRIITMVSYSRDLNANDFRLSGKTYYYYGNTSSIDYASLISLTFFITDNYGVSESEYVQNQAEIQVRIISDIKLYDIKLVGVFNNEIMNVHIPENLDTNQDGLIDEIEAERYYSFSFCSNTFDENQIKKKVTVSIKSIIGENVDIKTEEIVSIYYSKNSNEQGRPFDSNPDYYQFTNDSPLTLSELIHEAIFIATAVSTPLLLAWKALSASKGKCYGFSASTGAYFKYPSLKPIPGFPWDWGEDAPGVVSSNIIAYQFSQIAFFPSFKDPDIVYEKIKSEISGGNPVIVGLRDKNGGKHAVLATKITEFETSNLSTIHIYNTWKVDWLDEMYYDLKNKSIKPFDNSYIEFCVFPQAAFTISDPVIAMNQFLGYGAATLEDINAKVFAAACPIHMLAEDYYGHKVGFLEDGSYINEISGAEIQRIATGNFTGDSITYIYVPADNDYKVTLRAYDFGFARFEYYKPLPNSLMYTSFRDSIKLERETVIIFEDINSNKIKIDENGDEQIDKLLTMIEYPVETSVNDLYSLNILKIYPNPFSETVTIEIPNKNRSDYELTLLDLTGRTVRKISNIRSSKIFLHREGLANGIYLLEIRGDINYRSKLIIN